MTSPKAHPLTTPRAAALAGVLFGLLFGTALILIRTALPEGAEEGAQWLDAGSQRMKVSAILMPFAGIAFLWFIGVVRENFGRSEDKFFSSVFIGAGLTFLAMVFSASAIGAGLVASSREVVDVAAHIGGGHLRADGADRADQNLCAANGAPYS